MVVYKIYPEICYGDCKKVDEDLLLIKVSCRKRDTIMVGPIEIPCKKVNDDFILRLYKGKRARLGKDIYLDYENDKRIYLDYDMYMRIFSLVMATGSVRVFGTRYHKRSDGAITNEYGQVISKDYFEFGRLIEQPLFTKNGVQIMKIDDFCFLRKGECEVCTKDGTSICYGDPE